MINYCRHQDSSCACKEPHGCTVGQGFKSHFPVMSRLSPMHYWWDKPRIKDEPLSSQIPVNFQYSVFSNKLTIRPSSWCSIVHFSVFSTTRPSPSWTFQAASIHLYEYLESNPSVADELIDGNTYCLYSSAGPEHAGNRLLFISEHVIKLLRQTQGRY